MSHTIAPCIAPPCPAVPCGLGHFLTKSCRFQRSILINWLLAVIDEFQTEEDDGFYTGAHHQTVAILDHYCGKVCPAL